MLKAGCDLCDNVGGILLRETPEFRIILVEGADAQNYPGFCRVIWHNHVAEMTDLSKSAQIRLFSAVLAVEEIMRDVFLPHKINLASLGNMTPHIHWHIIPRYINDATFPNPIWAKPRLEDANTLNMSQTSYGEKISLLQTRILALHFDLSA